METSGRHSKVVNYVGGIALAVLAFSGSLKGTQGFSWLPFDLTLLSAVLVFTSSCFLFIREFQYSQVSPKFLLPFAVWVMFLIPAFGISYNQHTVEKVGALFTVTFLCAIAPFAILRYNAGQKSFVAALLAIGLYSTIGVLMSPDSVAYEYSNRLALQGATTITTAQMIGAGAIVAFLGVFALSSKILRLVSLLVAASMILACFYVGSRGPVIALILAIVVMILLGKSLRRNIVPGIVIVIVIIAATVYQAIRSGSDGFERILAFFTGSDVGGSGRSHLYNLASEIVVDNLLGVGWGGFIRYGTEYPHNLILEVLVEAGIGVAIVIILLLVSAFIRLLRGSERMMVTVFLGLLCFTVTNAMFSSDITGNKLMWMVVFTAFAMEEINPSFVERASFARGKANSKI